MLHKYLLPLDKQAGALGIFYLMYHGKHLLLFGLLKG